MINELTFNGKSFSEFSAYIATSNFLDGAAKDIQSVSVVGRSGALQLSNDKYNNLTLKVRMYITNDMQENMRKMRNFLESCWGYCRYEETQTPNEFRMASFKAAFVPDVYDVNVGVVDLTFDSMPQRFLKSGENWTTVSSSSSEISGNPVSISNPSGLTALTGLSVDIEPVQDLNGFDHPWVGGAGKNKLQVTVTGTTTYGITWAVDSDGVITANGTVPSDATGNAEIIVAGGWGRDGLVIGTDINLTVGNTYKLVKGNANTAESFFLFFSNSSGSVINNANANNGETTFTIPSGAVYLNAVLRINKGTTVSNLKVYPMIIATTESSDFEPYSNICPITGHSSVSVTRTGKNLLKYPYYHTTRTVNGITFTDNGDGSITINGTSTAVADFTIISASVNMPVANDSYKWVLLGSSENSNVYLHMRVNNGDDYINTFIGEQKPVTVTQNQIYSGSLRVRSGVTINGLTVYPMLIIASETDTTFETYTGNTYTIDLNGTRYGGTLNVLTGVLTVTHKAETFNGTESWGKEISQTGLINFYLNLDTSGKMAGRQGGLLDDELLCNWLAPSSTITTCAVYVNSTSKYLNCKCESVTEVADFKSIMSANPLVIVYPIATPQTVQLTAQQVSLLTGTNILSTDMNSLTVTISSPAELENPTLFESKPLIRVYGNGTLNVNDQYITVANSPYAYIDIDCELMDCYYQSNNANQYVSFSTTNYVTLRSGMNYFSYSGFTKVEVTPRWFEI